MLSFYFHCEFTPADFGTDIYKTARRTGAHQTHHPQVCILTTHRTWCVQVLRSPKEAFAAAIQSWRERCEKCVCLQGDYVEKCLHFQLPVVSSFFK